MIFIWYNYPNMNYFLDTEFTRLPWDKGSNLISVGLVKENGETYYACLDNFELEGFSDVVRDRIIPLLPNRLEWKKPEVIKNEILEFIEDKPSQFWSIFPDEKWLIKIGLPQEKVKSILDEFADYDLQLIKKLLGNDYPEDWPQRGSNLNQIFAEVKEKGLLPKNKNKHDALSDAIQAKETWIIYNN